MLLATWNVNSLNARLPRVLEFLQTVAPDVLCLQETKCTPEAFPQDALREAGYAAVHHSGGRWAGVAILAREGLALGDARAGLPGEVRPDQARWIEATVEGVRVASVYVVNGQAVDSEPFAEKLVFLDALAARAAELRDAGAPVAIAGDFNVCPTDRDVYDPAAFAGATHVTPQERGALAAILERGGLRDAHETVRPGEQQFTWWDYRAGHFHKGLGLRIDLVLVSDDLAGRLTRCGIERDFRKGTKPSDHAPLLADWSS
ncbi:exodeoxyribonuclease III [Conexibacter sp. W3-3-2]|uniref:Exodeoxyribonuclease III n=1 Tax=Paraconexibacter algicola TaxID=2133960 RepID=A0A2T4UFV1_9ACTN|nr:MULTISPECIES: exodeoxyribonuclease III [Solirubrobacterales]MTD44214.1 exodeoxyribonuclease III [Conexibacter sp. W3-3-2]PTL56641.1 exodeoxyribonuclease III [Paraconexibacter algicola]